MYLCFQICKHEFMCGLHTYINKGLQPMTLLVEGQFDYNRSLKSICEEEIHSNGNQISKLTSVS